MIKRFCDACGCELPNPHYSSIGGVCDLIGFKVLLCRPGQSYNTGDFCRPCVFDAVASCDDRGKPAAIAVAAPDSEWIEPDEDDDGNAIHWTKGEVIVTGRRKR